MLWLMCLGQAWARAGGGHSFGGGGGGEGRSFGGGGGSDGDNPLSVSLELYLLLLREHPLVGIAFTVAVIYLIARHERARAAQQPRTVVRGPRRVPRVDLAPLLARDPQFSEVLFLDYSRMMFARVHEERGRANLGALGALLSSGARASLDRFEQRPTRDVVVGSARIGALATRGNRELLNVVFEANVTEGDKHRWVREVWSFGRVYGALSSGPEAMSALRCPNCGSALECRPDGTCTNCGTPLANGRHLWCVDSIERVAARVLTGLDLHLGGGVEPGTTLPTVVAPDLGAQQRALLARHPELDLPAFKRRVEEVFLRVQAAWSARDRAALRPLETDAVFQSHRYWFDRYERERATNHGDQIIVGGVEVSRIQLDAWYTSITVRIFVSMFDWTVQEGRGVVGGSKTELRYFTEYWTFVRAAGKPAAPRASLDACPSCGAPLDKVGESGVCGYCDAKITTGQFDWVLAGIEQDEVYT
jgi:predicted lipid-binding transport protein (Tim44 family)